MELLGYIAIICIGLVLGSIGAGGSMLAIPVFVYLFAMDMETAGAYSLFLVGVTSLAGVALKQRQQIVCLRTAFFFGLPSISGAFISRKWIIEIIPDLLWRSSSLVLTKDHALLGLFSILMATSSLILLLKMKPAYEANSKPRLLYLMCLGFLVGLLAGLVGAGGGFIIIPALIILARQSFSTVTATSLVIIAANSLLGFCGDLLNRPIDWQLLLGITALSMLGLLLGYWWNNDVHRRFSPQLAFAWFTLIMALSILTKVSFHCFSDLIIFPLVQTSN
jgi:uncharacterized protein